MNTAAVLSAYTLTLIFTFPSFSTTNPPGASFQVLGLSAALLAMVDPVPAAGDPEPKSIEAVGTVKETVPTMLNFAVPVLPAKAVGAIKAAKIEKIISPLKKKFLTSLFCQHIPDYQVFEILSLIGLISGIKTIDDSRKAEEHHYRHQQESYIDEHQDERDDPHH